VRWLDRADAGNSLSSGYRWFESSPLQQRVSCELGPGSSVSPGAGSTDPQSVGDVLAIIRCCVNELALAGDDDGAATWRGIMPAVTKVANKTPPSQVHSHVRPCK
jgi:hypothetical protein